MPPICFAIMPFGTKKDAGGKEINFDKVYETLIRPAILEAGLEPIRADEEKAGGFIHQPMYERLLFCQFAVADLSAGNPNVFYEVGMRHAIVPHTTISIFDTATQLPFDVRPLRAMPYEYTMNGIADLETKIASLTELILFNKQNDPVPDSPLHQTIADYPFPDLSALAERASTFRKWATETQERIDRVKRLEKEWLRLHKERKLLQHKGQTIEDAALAGQQAALVDDLSEFEGAIDKNIRLEYNLLNALVKAYRATEAHNRTISLLHKVPGETMRENLFLQQQLAHAFNQAGRLEEAETLLLSLVEKFGNSPETSGLLGSMYRRKAARVKDTDPFQSAGFLENAMAAYKTGFDADPSDYYPGINLLNLLYTTGNDQAMFSKYLPLVAYAIERRVLQRPADYWALVSGMELEVLNNDQVKATAYFRKALASEPPPWEKKSSYESLERIYEQKKRNGEQVEWIKSLLAALE